MGLVWLGAVSIPRQPFRLRQVQVIGTSTASGAGAGASGRPMFQRADFPRWVRRHPVVGSGSETWTPLDFFLTFGRGIWEQPSFRNLPERSLPWKPRNRSTLAAPLRAVLVSLGLARGPKEVFHLWSPWSRGFLKNPCPHIFSLHPSPPPPPLLPLLPPPLPLSLPRPLPPLPRLRPSHPPDLGSRTLECEVSSRNWTGRGVGRGTLDSWTDQFNVTVGNQGPLP